jgi:hypothetical protein
MLIPENQARKILGMKKGVVATPFRGYYRITSGLPASGDPI